MLHMMKVAVGIRDIAHLTAINNQMASSNQGYPYTPTRFLPKQADAILKGGSLYRVINGFLCCRQKIIDFIPTPQENKHENKTDHQNKPPGIQIVLNPQIIRTVSIPIRPFQGWRYLKPENAPKDLPFNQVDAFMKLPPEMRRDLETLGLIDPI